MKTWRTMIVDDEEPTRQRTAELLSAHPEISIVATAGNIHEAKELFGKHQPELLLLDIEMPGGSGFDLLPSLDPAPKIIFVTAHSDFALHAFEVNAVDYVLKPVFPDRLAKALSRILGNEPPASGTNFKDKGVVFLRTEQGSVAMPTRDILHIAAAGNFSHVASSGRTRLMIYRTLSQWEERLPGRMFKRVDRSLIVNIDRIAKVIKVDRNHSLVQFQGNDQPLRIGRLALQRLNEEMRAS